jgi:hypothetical protein
VSGLATDRTVVNVSLLDVIPPWCREFDTDDDSKTDLAEDAPLTFGLLPIIEGVSRALPSGKPLFSVETVLEK